MSNEEEYICLINEKKQYSIWFAWKEIPRGWKKVGPQGTKDEVLSYINEVWQDIHPLILQRKA